MFSAARRRSVKFRRLRLCTSFGVLDAHVCHGGRVCLSSQTEGKETGCVLPMRRNENFYRDRKTMELGVCLCVCVGGVLSLLSLFKRRTLQKFRENNANHAEER